VIDVGPARDLFIKAACERYGFNVASLFAEHRKKLEAKHYLKRKTASRKSGQ
jgi:hypothetical protein